MAIFASSTQQVPETVAVPRHVAVIMDTDGRLGVAVLAVNTNVVSAPR